MYQIRGIGIDKKYQDLIFKSFTQVNSDLNRPYEGAGVGLTIAKKLVNLLKGDIWLDSTLGEGSSFFFTIPLYDVNNEMIRNNCENIIKSPAEFKNER
ncbi:sensory box histidine kinase/response regulator [Algibacter lectus]|uniref:histidine kinase n=1 Tax=Algibacter lectus TaxID=221126 RepID=A0A090WMA8_9FLAO|nr:ATP-binding protein [Algibacter lectus]GAL77348.1 sensory box histidine kinase/response regulator [Algibacter lectus]